MMIGMIVDANRDNIVVIDECEYLITRASNGDFYEHKGNCKNPIHYTDSLKNKE